MAKTIKLTDEGLKKLQEELEFLKTEGRKDIAEKIKVARGYGDLSENSEYDEAKNEQAKIEARIVELEAMLKNVELIEKGEGNETVQLGTRVKVLDVEFDEECEYQAAVLFRTNLPLEELLSDTASAKPLWLKLPRAKLSLRYSKFCNRLAETVSVLTDTKR